MYRHIASSFDFTEATVTSFRSHNASMSSIAVCPPYVYTASTDRSLVKWELAPPSVHLSTPRCKKSRRQDTRIQAPPPTRRRPIQVSTVKPFPSNRARNSEAPPHHTGPILSVAASSDGQFVVTGGDDNRLIIWSAVTLQPLKMFTHHRDSITGLAFRRGTNQLYSASKDRTVKTWSLNELAYVETLFGHQDCIVDVAALAMERCLSVGARDRTARLWKVVDETQLIFLGGGGSGDKKFHKLNGTSAVNLNYTVGSLDRVAFIDEDTFITGSDNGSLMLWTVHKKKPIFTYTLAHGLQPIENLEAVSAEQHPDDVHNIPRMPQPRWITALATVPYSDIIVSGSWDGWVRAWKVSSDRRKIEALGPVGKVVAGVHGHGHVGTNGIRDEPPQMNRQWDGGSAGIRNGSHGENQATGNSYREGMKHNDKQCLRGVVNDLKVFERGEKGKESLCIAVAVGKEHRLGRWMQVDGKNDAFVLDVPRKQIGAKKKRKKTKMVACAKIEEKSSADSCG